MTTSSQRVLIALCERYERALVDIREVLPTMPHKAGMHDHGEDQSHRCPRCKIAHILDEAGIAPVP